MFRYIVKVLLFGFLRIHIPSYPLEVIEKEQFNWTAKGR